MPLPPSSLNQANRQSPEEIEGNPSHLSEASRGTDHPYFRLYQYLHQGAPHKNDCTTGASSPRPPAGHRGDEMHCPGPPPSVVSAPPPQSRRGHAPSPPSTYDRDKPLPAAPPTKAPPSSLAPPTYGGETEPPQRQPSQSGKKAAPSPGGHTPTRGPAPPPPAISPAHRPTAPTATRDAPPPPPYRTAASPSLSSDPPVRAKPPPPPPPPLRHGHPSSGIPYLCDDFESKYLFHPLDDFPPPDEYRYFAKIYPSKAYSVVRGAPPLPPVAR